MIFVSMLVYPLESARRFAAERCLWQLLCQLERDDVLLTFEKPQLSDRNEVWRLKPKVFGLGLAIAQRNEWACWVDADIEFRDGFVKRLKEFLRTIGNNPIPTLVISKVWGKGEENWIADEKIRDYWQRAMISKDEWEFYCTTGLFAANKAFLAYIDEWQRLTDKSQYYPEETALVSLAHKYRDKWRIVWLPEELHFIGWKVRQGEEKAFAVHIGSDQISRWLSVALQVSELDGRAPARPNSVHQWEGEAPAEPPKMKEVNNDAS